MRGAGVRVTGVSAPFRGVLPLPGPVTFQGAGALVLQQQGRLAPGENTELRRARMLSCQCPRGCWFRGATPGIPRQRLSAAAALPDRAGASLVTEG